MEYIIKDCILNHLNKFSLIRDSQHGFTKNRSCITNLLEFMEEVTSTVENQLISYTQILRKCHKVPYQRLLKI